MAQVAIVAARFPAIRQAAASLVSRVGIPGFMSKFAGHASKLAPRLVSRLGQLGGRAGSAVAARGRALGAPSARMMGQMLVATGVYVSVDQAMAALNDGSVSEASLVSAYELMAEEVFAELGLGNEHRQWFDAAYAALISDGDGINEAEMEGLIRSADRLRGGAPAPPPEDNRGDLDLSSLDGGWGFGGTDEESIAQVIASLRGERTPGVSSGGELRHSCAELDAKALRQVTSKIKNLAVALGISPANARRAFLAISDLDAFEVQKHAEIYDERDRSWRN